MELLIGGVFVDTDARRKDLTRAIRVKMLSDGVATAELGNFQEGVFSPNGALVQLKASRLNPHGHWRRVRVRMAGCR